MYKLNFYVFGKKCKKNMSISLLFCILTIYISNALLYFSLDLKISNAISEKQIDLEVNILSTYISVE